MKTYTFDTPQTIGDLANQTVLRAMNLVSFAVNLNPPSNPAAAVLSIVLLDAGSSGYQCNVMYTGQAAVDWWNQIKVQNLSTASYDLESVILAKLKADGKIPPGTIA